MDDEFKDLYDRHRGLAEAVNGQLKESHPLRRARWRGLWKAQAQAVTALNLQTLAEAEREQQQVARRAASGLQRAVEWLLSDSDGG